MHKSKIVCTALLAATLSAAAGPRIVDSEVEMAQDPSLILPSILIYNVNIIVIAPTPFQGSILLVNHI